MVLVRQISANSKAPETEQAMSCVERVWFSSRIRDLSIVPLTRWLCVVRGRAGLPYMRILEVRVAPMLCVGTRQGS